MELRHLRYFIALAEELHFGRAARRLHITQPPLSFNIKQLESHLGVALFVRDSRNVALTSAGQAFLGAARRVVAQAAQAEETVRASNEGQFGHLRLGFTSSMIYRGMPELLLDFTQRYPKVDYQLIDGGVSDQTTALKQGDLDGGFMPSMVVPGGLAAVRLFEDSYVCCLPKDHWAADLKHISIAKLAEENFVLFAREFTPSGHEYVVSLCIEAGFQPRAAHYVRQWLAGLALVSKGFGVALMPSSMAKAGFSDVRFIGIDEAKPYCAYFAWNSDQVSPALKVLIAHLRRALRHGEDPNLRR